MHKHPLNLTLRFILELAALFGVGQWAWKLGTTPALNWVFLVVSLVIFMGIWVIFNVPGDPSRSGKAPVVVRGWLRLVIELTLFGLSVWAFFSSGFVITVWVMSGLLIFHYAVSYERIQWLLAQ
jgi:hypothetical protein